MVTRLQQQAIDLYSELMEEVKIRLGAIELAVDGKIPLPGRLVEEFCYLQLRMLCELIALGCMTAHGDIAQTKKLQGTWEADKMIKQLEQLHPQFFPRAVKMNIVTNVSIQISDDDSVYLTKDELLLLWRKCGERLHRGNAKKLLSSRMPIQVHFRDVDGWARKIGNLLDQHHIASSDNKRHFIVALKVLELGGRTQVAFAESPV